MRTSTPFQSSSSSTNERYRTLVLQAAEGICRDRRDIECDELRMLCLTSVLASENGHDALATACLHRLATLDPDEAASCARAVSAGRAVPKPGQDEPSVDAFRARVETLERLGRRDEAVSAWCQLGEAFHRRHQLQDADAAYREALARKSDCLKALWGLAGVHFQLAEPIQAIAFADAALAIEPTHGPAHQLRGWALHHVGDVEPGWEEMARFDNQNHLQLRDFEQPRWEGGCLDGGTVLLWADEALGDTIQWIRYARMIAQRGTRVIVQCDRRLVPLIEGVPYVDRVVARRMPLPAFDAHAPFSDLPRVLGTRADNIPDDVPYLSADPQLVSEWRTRIDSSPDTLAVGLVWGGDPDRTSASLRFMPLDVFAPLAGLQHVRFVSLQHGMPAAYLLAPPDGLHIDVFSEESRSIQDTAAVIQNLDLVVTADTMTAHLAGALAKTVWVLLPHAPDWRWRVKGDSSPWYPTMRLFRQTNPGNWSEPVARVRKALEALSARPAGRRSP